MKAAEFHRFKEFLPTIEGLLPELISIRTCDVGFYPTLTERATVAFRLYTKMSEECPVCYAVGGSHQFLRCGNGHLVCSECFPHIHGCPLCRGSLRDFTDSNGLAMFSACPNIHVGCDVVIPRGGNHTCPLDLLVQLTTDQRNIVGYILTSMAIYDEPTFVWTVPAIILMDEMFKKYMDNPDVWERFFGDDSDTLNNLLMIIS
jgi:hypothetical protein